MLIDLVRVVVCIINMNGNSHLFLTLSWLRLHFEIFIGVNLRQSVFLVEIEVWICIFVISSIVVTLHVVLLRGSSIPVVSKFIGKRHYALIESLRRREQSLIVLGIALFIQWLLLLHIYRLLLLKLLLKDSWVERLVDISEWNHLIIVFSQWCLYALWLVTLV